MTTHYLYATILTGEAVAANNRGDNLGNTTTLQKVFHQDNVHTSISAEAIRFALRYHFQLSGLSVNRRYDGDRLLYEYEDEKRTYWGSRPPFIDDDLMGFMDAAAAQAEREDEKAEPASAAKSGRKKGTVTKRTSPLAVGRAVSLRPYRGELSFNCVSGVKEKGKLSLYNAEMHTTEYQYSIALNLNDVRNKKNIGHLIDALIDPPKVAGNHSRFYYDFSPASIVFRVTSAHASRIQNCFEHDEEGRTYTVARLIRRVESGDIPAEELIIGGELSHTKDGETLGKLRVTVLDGIRKAADEARRRIAQRDKAFAVLAEGR